MSSHLVLGHVEGSNLPSRAKSQIRQWVERAGGITKFGGRVKSHAHAAVQAVRGGGEAGFTGLALGALHAEGKTGLDVFEGKVPVDALVGAGGLIGSVLLAEHETATDSRNIGISGTAIFSFRKMHDYLAERKIAKGEVPGSAVPKGAPAAAHGDAMGAEDPVVAAARLL